MDYSGRALRIRPEDSLGHVTLAETLAATGRVVEADWHFRIATSLSPLSTSAHNSYGKFLLLQGRSEDARTEYERSASADFNTDAYKQLGNIYLTWQDFPRAEKAFRHALAGDAFDSQAHFGLGKVLEVTSRPAEALREYESGLAMDPSDAPARAAANRLRNGTSPQADVH